MTDLVPGTKDRLTRNDARGLNRNLSRLDGRGRFELAGIEQAAHLQAARVAAISHVSKRAMHELTIVSQCEQSLSRFVPAASDRLQGLADLTAISMAEVVADTARRMQS